MDAAIELLDERGEGGLTFRVLTERLATGPGAIYWHVPNKSALVAAAADRIVSGVVGRVSPEADPPDVIRAIAIGMFNAIDAHPWVAVEVIRAPWESALLTLFERLGRQIDLLGVRSEDRFPVAVTLMNYILGVSAEYASGSRLVDRADFLSITADAWAALEPERFAFTRSVAEAHRVQDRRHVFLSGIDLLLAGIDARGSDTERS